MSEEKTIENLQESFNHSMSDLNIRLEQQMKKAFFDKLHQDFKKNPPDTNHISICIHELYESLCKFVPSKQEIHLQIKKDLIHQNVNLDTMPFIVNGLINWIEAFQAPFHDIKTKQWRLDFKQCKDYADFLRDFFESYYNHIEIVYKESWEARKRLIQGENIVPPQYRQVVKGKNGIPDVMKSGL